MGAHSRPDASSLPRRPTTVPGLGSSVAGIDPKLVTNHHARRKTNPATMGAAIRKGNGVCRRRMSMPRLNPSPVIMPGVDARQPLRIERPKDAGRACQARRAPPIRTLTVGTGIPPVQPPAIHVDDLRVADYHRRFGLSPTPGTFNIAQS